jgi:rhamnose transport system substrate-binding protein
MGKAMVEMMVKEAGSEGDFLIVTAVLTAPNQNRWIEEVKKYASEKYPKMRFAGVLPGDEDLEKSKNVALNYLRANPNTKGVLCVTGIATPGVAEAVKQLGLQGKVAMTGLGVPSLVRPYVKDGTIKQVLCGTRWTLDMERFISPKRNWMGRLILRQDSSKLDA